MESPKNPQALGVQKNTTGIPCSSAASKVKLMIPSERMQLILGTPTVLFIFTIRSRNGTEQFLLVESQRAGTSWVASRSEGGRPSGMVSNRKSSRPFRESGPLDLNSRLWLNSVLTNVMKKPLLWRSLASLSMGVTWP
ncbi:hypothetical protein AAC387_Pa01g1141 [Persea americana]